LYRNNSIKEMKNPALKEKGRKDYHPKEQIEESIRGVDFDFFYTGKKLGSGSLIELHVTSIVRDWEENVFIRKSWYSGYKKEWRECLREHVRQHLTDLCAGKMLVMSLMREFEVKEEHFREWKEYNPIYL
jgi:hypothetical protein